MHLNWPAATGHLPAVHLLLAGLPQLRSIAAPGCDNAGLAAVALPGLTSLALGSSSALADLRPLAACTALLSLDLSDNLAWGLHIAPLTACLSLRDLDLRHCSGVISVAPLAGCPALARLDVSDCPWLAALCGLEACASLTELYVGGQLLSDIAALAGCTALLTLSIHGHSPKVTDIAVIAALGTLTSLELLDMQIANLHPLLACTSLLSLDIHRCYAIVDLRPLTQHPSLTALRLTLGNAYYVSTAPAPIPQEADLATLVDSSPLCSCGALISLALEASLHITDVGPLSSCPSLQHLDLWHLRNLRDITLLGEPKAFPSLTSLRLLCPPVLDLTCLTRHTALQLLELWGPKAAVAAGVRSLAARAGLAITHTGGWL